MNSLEEYPGEVTVQQMAAHFPSLPIAGLAPVGHVAGKERTSPIYKRTVFRFRCADPKRKETPMADHVAPADRPLAIVTGAGSGIGAATARLLAGRGMVIALVGRREEKLAEVALAIEDTGGEAANFPADL